MVRLKYFAHRGIVLGFTRSLVINVAGAMPLRGRCLNNTNVTTLILAQPFLCIVIEDVGLEALRKAIKYLGLFYHPDPATRD